MKWEDYYDRFWEWADSTRVSRISALTDFTSSAEVAEIAAEFYDEKIASRLVRRAMQHGVRFTPGEILGMGDFITEEALAEAIRNRRGQFSAAEYEALKDVCFDDALLDEVIGASSGFVKWAHYYDRFRDWDKSLQIAKIPALTEFTSSAEVAEIAAEFYDKKDASRLIDRAMQKGIRFTPEEIVEMGDNLTADALGRAVRNCRGTFSAAEFEELECICSNDSLLAEVAKAGGIRRGDDDPPVEPPDDSAVLRKAGRIAALLGIAAFIGRGGAHSGRCTGDCANCPEHYGYWYGRWYYGRHHSHGCEFGGNSGSGGL